MQNAHKTIGLLGGLLLVALLVVSPPAGAEDDEGTNRMAELSKLLDGAIPLTKAIETALKHKTCARGQAVAAKIDSEDGKPVWEVYVVVGGDTPRIAEVEIDAKTGEILEVEFEDGDEEEEDDSEEGTDDEED